MITAENLSKCYTIHSRATDRLHDWVLPWRPRRGRPFWALRGIDLSIARGTSLGIVGVNGAGKSTLLKILTGTTVPTGGTFRVDGRVSALLELGMGFHPEFTGRENIAFNGRMLGLGDEELREKTPAIIEFSEIADFIDQPIRTYSSGMTLRLAFAVASSVDPDVLIVDEALSVGDLHFQQKCLARIRQFHERGVTVLFVSHDPALVKTFCTEAVLLDQGVIAERGRPDHVLDYYTALLAEKYREQGREARVLKPSGAGQAVAMDGSQGGGDDAAEEGGLPPPPKAEAGHRTGNFRVVITGIELRSEGRGGNGRLVTTGNPAVIRLRATALDAVPSPTVGILIKDRLGNDVYGTNTAIRGLAIPAMKSGDAVDIEFAAPMNLGEGLYSITAAIHGGEAHTETCYDWIERAETFQILPTPSDRFLGGCRLDMRIAHQVVPATPGERAAARAFGGRSD